MTPLPRAARLGERKKAISKLASSPMPEVLVTVFDNGIDRIDRIAADGSLTSINAAGRSTLGYAAKHQMTGGAWLDLWPVADRPDIAAHLALAQAGRATRFTASSGAVADRRWWDVILSPAPGDGLVAQARDVTETRAAESDFRYRAQHDGLTGLPNRAALKDELTLAIARADATGRTGAVLMLDLDNFKLINDTLGHEIGDVTLQAVAEGLREVIGGIDIPARLGGDEFAVILNDIADLDALRVVVEKLLKRLARPFEAKGRTLTPCASVGAALFPKHGRTPADLLKHADIALYAAKSFGRGGYVLFVPSMGGPIRRRAAAAAAVRGALADNRVDVFYQPMLDLGSGALLGFETKLQITLPDGRTMPPAEIASVHDDVDLAQAMGGRVLARITDDARRWRNGGLALSRIAVNACAAEFRTGDYAERFLARLAEAGLPPALFDVEVAETVFAGRGSDYVASALKVLSGAGVRVALDAFGTGPASLSHLKRLPVSGVKIDGSFVEGVEYDPADGAIVRAMIGLANGFGIGLAAEGVRTQGQAAMLRALGCKVGQGDLFGAPAPASAIPAMIAAVRHPLVDLAA